MSIYFFITYIYISVKSLFNFVFEPCAFHAGRAARAVAQLLECAEVGVDEHHLRSALEVEFVGAVTPDVAPGAEVALRRRGRGADREDAEGDLLERAELGPVELPPLLRRHAELDLALVVCGEQGGITHVLVVGELGQRTVVGAGGDGEVLEDLLYMLHDLLDGKAVLVVVVGAERVSDVVDWECHPLPALPVLGESMPLEVEGHPSVVLVPGVPNDPHTCSMTEKVSFCVWVCVCVAHRCTRDACNDSRDPSA